MTMAQDKHRAQKRFRPRKRLDRRGLPVDASDPHGGDRDRDRSSDRGTASDPDQHAIPAQDITEPDPTRIGER